MSAAKDRVRIGLFGGSFDPIHTGHLILAEDALQAAALDWIVFLPAFSSPLRSREAETAPENRLAMVRAAVTGFSSFEVDDFDLRQGRQVYTVETVRHYRERYPAAELFFLIGFDQYQKLPQWHEVEELRRELTFLCAARDEGGPLDPIPAGDLSDEKVIALPPRRIDISATEIRKRVAAGQSIRSLVPGAVADLIESHSLYAGG